jgi:hypothetical protein
MKEARLELLKDDKGIYGLGFVGEKYVDTSPLIVREDKLKEATSNFNPTIMFQTIRDHGIFIRSHEWLLAQSLHSEMLSRNVPEWDHHKPNEEERHRYFGLKKSAFAVTNSLIAELLTIIPDDVLKTVRRYPLYYRYGIYKHLITEGLRAIQLANTFPALAAVIYCDLHFYDVYPELFGQRREEAKEMVREGKPLRSIVDCIGIPMCLRSFKPAISRRVLANFDTIQRKKVFCYLPKTVPMQRKWISALSIAESGGPEFVVWVAKHALSLGKNRLEIIGTIENLVDWVKVSTIASLTDQQRFFVDTQRMLNGENNNGIDFVARQFNKDMSVETVLMLSNEWHKTIVENMPEGTNCQFPVPWYDGEVINGLSITPIQTYAELYMEGKTMRHCVATYKDSVLRHSSYTYSVTTADDTKLATFELYYSNGKISLGQIRGKCNALMPNEITKVIKKWFSNNKKKHGLGKWTEPLDLPGVETADEFCNDRPF